MITSLNRDIFESFRDIFVRIGTISADLGTLGEIPGHFGKIRDIFHGTRTKFTGRMVGKRDAAVGTLFELSGRRILVRDVGITSESHTFWDILFGTFRIAGHFGVKEEWDVGNILGTLRWLRSLGHLIWDTLASFGTF